MALPADLNSLKSKYFISIFPATNDLKISPLTVTFNEIINASLYMHLAENKDILSNDEVRTDIANYVKLKRVEAYMTYFSL